VSQFFRSELELYVDTAPVSTVLSRISSGAA